MRTAVILLLLLLTFSLVGATESCNAQAKVFSPTATVFGGVYTSEFKGESFGDNFGCGLGFLGTINKHLGIYGTYEYQDNYPEEGKEQFDLSGYLAVTLAQSTKFKLSGLAGFEYDNGKMFGFEWDDPYVGLGGLLQFDVAEGFGLFGSLTTTMDDGTELGDAMKIRTGLSYTF